MRVIAGTARRLNLITPKGLDTRPTTDRIKETLFNILQPDLYGCRFLDLFSGSGGIGIEALSRGADHAVFVDNSREAVRCIRENLMHTHLNDRAEVLQMDCAAAIRAIAGREAPFDMIFLDPPYGERLEIPVLAALAESGLAGASSMVILEEELRYCFPGASETGFVPVREKKYKTNQHIFLKLDSENRGSGAI